MHTQDNATQEIAARAANNGFYAGQAEMFSKNLAEQFEQEHQSLNFSNEHQKAAISNARLEALNLHGRDMLSGKFSRSEFAGLLSCFQSEIFFPASIEDMAGAVNDDSPSNYMLAKKVAQLSKLELYALADALELTWHKQSNEQDVFEVAEALGLKFANSKSK